MKFKAPEITATAVLAIVGLGLGAFVFWRGTKVVKEAWNAVAAIPEKIVEYAQQVGEGVKAGFENPELENGGRGNKYSGIIDGIYDDSASVGISA